MSEPSETDQTQPETPPVETPPAAPAPTYVTVEQMQQLERSISGQLNEAMQTFRSMMVPAARPATEPTGELTDAQIDEAVSEGRMTVSQAARKIAERTTAQLKREHVDPLQATGFSSLAGLTKAAAMPLMPHYKKYQREIDDYIAKLPEGSRLSPEVYKAVHDTVVGSHIEELLTAEREAAVRSANAPKPENAASQTRSGRTNATNSQVPTVEELLGPEAAVAMEAKGKTPDEFVRTLPGRYKDWKSYAEMIVKQQQEVA